MKPGVVDPTMTELVRAVLEMGADDDWRPVLVAIAADSGQMTGDLSDHERGIAAVEAAAAEVGALRSDGRVKAAEGRWLLHFADADADDRTLARDTLLRDQAARRALGARSVRLGARLIPDDMGTATTSMPPYVEFTFCHSPPDDVGCSWNE